MSVNLVAVERLLSGDYDLVFHFAKKGVTVFECRACVSGSVWDQKSPWQQRKLVAYVKRGAKHWYKTRPRGNTICFPPRVTQSQSEPPTSVKP